MRCAMRKAVTLRPNRGAAFKVAPLFIAASLFGQTPDSSFQISVALNLVELHVTVRDRSGGMSAKMTDVVAAAEEFAKSSNPQDQMFVGNFNEHASLGLPSKVAFTHFATLLSEAIETAPVAGQTALYDALNLAIGRLPEGKPEKKVLVVFSAGGDNASK